MRRSTPAIGFILLIMTAVGAAAEQVQLPDGRVIDGFADISSTIMGACADVRYDETGIGSLYAVARSYKSFLDIRFELRAGGYPWAARALQDVVRCLSGNGATQPREARTKKTPSAQKHLAQPEPRELTEEEKAARRDAIADKASNQLLAGFEDKDPGDDSVEKPASHRSDNDSKPPKYEPAVACVQILKTGHGFFSNTLGNRCGYKVTVSFCSLSGRGTGAFDCRKRSYGNDMIGAGKSQAVMGAGVPDADDTFELLYAACRFPGIPAVSGLTGSRLVFSCQ